MRESLHHILFIDDNLFLPVVDDIVFVDYLHGVELPIALKTTEVDSGETPSSQTTAYIKTI